MSKQIGTLAGAVSKILKEVAKEQEDQFAEAVDKATAKAVKDIKQNAPKDHGDYRAGWRRRKLSKTNYVIYNETKPQLTHLLEKSHLIRNANGTWGRSKPQPHIAPAEEQAVQEILEACSKPLDIKSDDTTIKV